MNDKNSKIEISVDLDENKIPEKILWSAEDGNIKNKQSKAIFLSVWDSEKKEHYGKKISMVVINGLF